MKTLSFVLLSVILVLLVYNLVQPVFSKKENRVIQKAKIDKISLQQIGKLWSPELVILYFFSYNSTIYMGRGYFHIDNLLSEWEILLFDRNGFPVLKTEIGEFAGEEHIESFILSQAPDILVEFNTYTLPDTKIYRPPSEMKSLFPNTFIRFPWT